MRRGGGGGRRLTRADANYKEVRRRIVRNQKRNEQMPVVEETYVDAYRSLAVQLGTARDLKSVIQRGRPQANVVPQAKGGECVDGDEERDTRIYVKQAKHLMQRGRLTHALQLLHIALNMAPLDPVVRTTEAQCLLLMGAWEMASTSADAVLNAGGKWVRALLVKAEALYNTCHFEHALVLFHRGRTSAPDWIAFQLGVHKCRETIETTVANAPKLGEEGIDGFLQTLMNQAPLSGESDALSSDQDSHYYDYESHKEADEDNDDGNENDDNDDDNENDEDDVDSELVLNTTRVKVGRIDRLQHDKCYLMTLEERFRDSHQGISSTASDVLNHLEARNEFWNQVDSNNEKSNHGTEDICSRLDFNELKAQGVIQ